MRYTIFSLVLATTLFFSCQDSSDNNFDKQKYETELSKHAQDYMMGLKNVLVENMKKGGPIQAVNVCSDTASDLTQSYSDKYKVTVKRFSFKNRNPKNIADSFEEKVLYEFEKLMREGKLNKKSSRIEKVTLNGRPAVKLVKPIFIDAPCLNCHGSNNQINSEVANVISTKYPNDKATGYKIGDLRGAISVTKVL